MLFNSAHFLFFFPFFVLLFFSLPQKYRKPLLLVASYYFYLSWKIEYGILLLTSTAVDYFSALQIEKRDSKTAKRNFLLLSILVNLTFLFSFKYLGFAVKNVIRFVDILGPSLPNPIDEILLPIGISFYTFQSMSYTIDVFRGEIKAERSFVSFALFVSFFPQLVAGPIERFAHLRPQFDKLAKPDAHRFAIGLKMMFWGYFQKIVIADSMAPFVNAAYGAPHNYSGLAMVIATVFFAFQIYCDFAGYTAIARGTAKIIGIDLVPNFRQPYFSFSFIDFWRRWHMSLFSWFKSYVYISLGGNRFGTVVKFRNIFIVFIVSGIWHGANWTFIAWGVLNGIFYLAELYFNKVMNISGLEKTKFYSPERLLRTIFVFSMVNITWVFFRAESISSAMLIFRRILFHFSEPLAFGNIGIAVNVFLISILMVVHWYDRNSDIIERSTQLPMPIRWGIYIFLGVLFVGLGNFGAQQFIYFQF